MRANQFVSCPVCGQTPCNCTHIAEGLRDPKDNPCWKGYHPVGTKKKNGRTVPNCVPNANEGVAEGSLEEYGDTKQGQKMLDKVHHRAANRVTSKQADKDPAYARRAQQTQDRAWDRMKDKDVAEATGNPGMPHDFTAVQPGAEVWYKGRFAGWTTGKVYDDPYGKSGKMVAFEPNPSEFPGDEGRILSLPYDEVSLRKSTSIGKLKGSGQGLAEGSMKRIIGYRVVGTDIFIPIKDFEQDARYYELRGYEFEPVWDDEQGVAEGPGHPAPGQATPSAAERKKSRDYQFTAAAKKARNAQDRKGVAEGFERFQVGDKISFPMSQMATGVVDKIDDKRLYVKLDNGDVYTIPSTMLHSVKLLERQGVAEGFEETEETAVINTFEKLVKQGRDPIDMITHKFGWGSYELDQLAQNLGFKNSAEWARGVRQGKGVNEGVAEGEKNWWTT